MVLAVARRTALSKMESCFQMILQSLLVHLGSLTMAANFSGPTIRACSNLLTIGWLKAGVLSGTGSLGRSDPTSPTFLACHRIQHQSLWALVACIPCQEAFWPSAGQQCIAVYASRAWNASPVASRTACGRCTVWPERLHSTTRPRQLRRLLLGAPSQLSHSMPYSSRTSHRALVTGIGRVLACPPAFRPRSAIACASLSFSAMVAFDRPLKLPYDGITFGNSPLWFAARSASKGFGPAIQRSTTGSSADGAAAAGCHECWTLISTPRFAVDEIQSTPMQDAVTGAFKPQEDSYLNTTPAPALLKAFMDAVTSLRPDPSPEFPTAVYLQGQRWGSALPAPAGIGGRDGFGRGAEATTEMGVTYDMSTPPLVYARPDPMESGRSAEDYLADAPLGLYYAGDFCSGRAPGFEAAALSGNDAAECLQRTLLQ